MSNFSQIDLTMFRPALWSPPHDEAAQKRLPSLTRALDQRLTEICHRFSIVKLASSLSVEDMVITDSIVRLGLDVEVFTLNTGRLNQETLALLPAAQKRWHLTIKEYKANALEVTRYVKEHGHNAFYESVELRRLCCYIRKIEPLNRALLNANAWLTGQRCEQSTTRTDLSYKELDQARQISKFNVIFDWHESDVWAYAQAHQVPVNELYQQGYPSIGCEPCSKPVKLGDDIRSGRWWWENVDSKECGLHK